MQYSQALDGRNSLATMEALFRVAGPRCSKRNSTLPTFSMLPPRRLQLCVSFTSRPPSRSLALSALLRRAAAHHPPQGADPRSPLQHARSRHGNVSRSDALLQLESPSHRAADEGSCRSLVRQLAHVRADGKGGDVWWVNAVRSVRTN